MKGACFTWLSWFCIIGWCSLLHAAEQLPTDLPRVQIYLLTDEMPAPDGTESASTQRLRRQLAEFPGLQYDIQYVSWPKALTEVARRADALVYEIARTPSREKRYHWLFPNETSNLYLYALADEPLRHASLQQLQQQPAVKIACPAQSAHCEMLRLSGFNKEQVLEVRLSEQTSVERLLLAKRVQFIAVAAEDFRRRMAILKVPPTDYVTGPQVASLTNYLAGGPALHPALRKLLSRDTVPSL
jgi:hypothetical protein